MIILMRHAKYYEGSLSQEGIEQSQNAALQLIDLMEEFDLHKASVHHSPVPRAEETAFHVWHTLANHEYDAKMKEDRYLGCNRKQVMATLIDIQAEASNDIAHVVVTHEPDLKALTNITFDNCQLLQWQN